MSVAAAPGRPSAGPLRVALATFLLYAGFVALQVHPTGDFSRFIMAGNAWCDPELVPPGLTVVVEPGKVGAGFDGQFYYRLALNPFTTEEREFGIQLPLPAHRQQRIVYPLLAWLFSLARPEWVPVSLVLVNLVAAAALGWLGALYARALGRSEAWGFLFSLYPGVLWVIHHDLTENVEAVFLVAALLAHRQGRPHRMAVCLALAVASRETALLAALAAFPFWWWDLVVRRPAVLAWPLRTWLLPLAVYLAGQAVLALIWTETPASQTAAGNLGSPLAGLAGLLENEAAVPKTWWFLGWLSATLALFGAAVLRAPGGYGWERLGLALNLALVSVLTYANWAGAMDMLRMLQPAWYFGLALTLGAGGRLPGLLALVTGAMGVYTFDYLTGFHRFPTLNWLFPW